MTYKASDYDHFFSKVAKAIGLVGLEIRRCVDETKGTKIVGLVSASLIVTTVLLRLSVNSLLKNIIGIYIRSIRKATRLHSWQLLCLLTKSPLSRC